MLSHFFLCCSVTNSLRATQEKKRALLLSSEKKIAIQTER